MRTAASALCLGLLVAVAGCAQEGARDGQLSRRVQTLENSVAALQERNADLALKGQIVSGMAFRSPLADFFASPEFWENTYDSAEADCARRCIAEIQAHRAQCAQMTDPNQRLQCYQEASDRGARCQQQCAGL